MEYRLCPVGCLVHRSVVRVFVDGRNLEAHFKEVGQSSSVQDLLESVVVLQHGKISAGQGMADRGYGLSVREGECS